MLDAFDILDQEEPQNLEKDEAKEIFEPQLEETEFQRAQNAMNLGQREVLRRFTESIQAQQAGSNERLRLFITGNAGTGKSFVLKLLREQANRCYSGERVVR